MCDNVKEHDLFALSDFTFKRDISFHTFFIFIYVLHINISSTPQKWPNPLKQTQFRGNPPHLRNTSPNLGNQAINILENLGIVKDIKNIMKFLGKLPKGRMKIFKVSLKLLEEWQNC